MFRRQRSRSRSARSKSPSFSFASFFSGRTRCSAERAVALRNGLGRRLFVEELEDRRMLTSTLYVDFGDLFPVAGFTGNLGTLKTATSGVPGDPAVRGPVMDGTLNSDWDVGNDGSTTNDMRDTDNFTMTSFNNAFTAFGAVYTGGVTQLRADIMTFVRRFYEPFDIDVIELTSTAINVNGRMVTAAANLAQISSTLGANETLTKNNDAYVLLGDMTVHRPPAAGGDFDPSTIFGGYASTADMPASNDLDNSALVYLRQNMFAGANMAGFFGNLISHEAGHDFGFQHSLTTAPGGTVSPQIPTSEIMSYLGGNGFNFFSRFPMVRGNSNTTNNDDLMAVSPPSPATNRTPYDQWVNTASIGANPDFNYITGTGAHDIITITKTGANALVTVQAFSNSTYATALVVPGTAGASTTYSYTVSLDRALVIDGGDLDDRIVIDGDLGTQVLVRGMSGTDALIVEGKGVATATYTPGVSDALGLDGLSNLHGQIIVGATTINFQEFELNSLVTIRDVAGAVRYELSDLSDNVRLARDAGGFITLTGTVNTADLAPVRFDAIGGLNLYGLAGNDTLTVDSTNGLLATFPLYYDGGAGFDRLDLTQSGGPTRTSSRINVGAQPGAGQSVIDTQVVSFENLEPVVDAVAAASFSITSIPGLATLLQAANAINYVQGQIAPTNGRVTVDDFEPIEFTNKGQLIIDAGAGSDEINLNNPTTPTGLTNITVNGDDPTASDHVIINGTAAANVIVVDQLVTAGARITGAQPVPVTLTTTEHLTINGQGGNDTLRVITPAGLQEIFLTDSSPLIDAGEIEIRNDIGAGGNALLPMSFVGLGGSGLVELQDIGGTRVDELTFTSQDGTSNDNFSVNAVGQISLSQTSAGAVSTQFLPVNTAGVALLNLISGDGDDTFDIAGNHPYTSAAGPAIFVEGGNPSASDVLILSGAAAVAETVTIAPDAANSTMQLITGLGGSILASGVERIRYTGAGNDDVLNVNLGTGVATARVQNARTATDEVLSSRLPIVEFSAIADFTLQGATSPTSATFVPDNLQGASGGADALNAYTFASNNGNDTLIIEGDGGGVQAGATDTVTVSLNGSNVRIVAVNGANTRTIETTGMGTSDALDIVSLAGNDSLTIDVSTGQLITSKIFFDGGTGTDTLTVQGAFDGGVGDTTTVTYTPGLPADEGRLVYTETAPEARTMDVTFDNVEPVIDTTTADELTINGNGGANSMTAAQDPAAATRVLVSVDGFETMSFNNKASFTLNGLGGDDTIVVDIAAAAVITGLVSLRVNGNEGHDEIRFENLPTAAGFTSARADGGSGNDVIDASMIPITTVKPLTLNGDAGNDVITGGPNGDTINGGDGDDTIIASPGNDSVTGGAGIDQLHIIGTDLADTITANQTAAATLVVNVTTNAVLSTRSYTIATIEKARIDAGEGDDLIAVNVVDAVPAANSLPFEVIGNSPNASDRLIVNDDGMGDLVIHSEGPDGRSGSVVIGPTGAGNTLLAKPKVQVDYYSIERVDVTPLDVVGPAGGTGPSQGLTGTDAGGRLLVFKYDDFETNESMTNATPVGLIPVYFGQRNIDPGGVALPAPFNGIPGDADWYEFRPTKTGVFRFEILFEHIVQTTNLRPGLPGNGDLRLDVFRADGTVIASSNSSIPTAINVDTSESVEVSLLADANPALTQSVFIRVKGAGDSASPAINIYDFVVTEVDDDGPQVFDPAGPTEAIFPNNLSDYNLFDPKPVTAGPSPLIHSITINIRDLPIRGPGDLIPALDELISESPGLYSLVGDHVGYIDIIDVDVINNPVVVGQQATATITLFFAEALPDDRFTLTILDGVVDPAGNNLDGESDADEPGSPSFPSGNTIEGGDFQARFTVDTRPEIGAAVGADIDVDINGNYHWDLNNEQIGNDHTNVDLSFTLLVQSGVNGPLAPGGFNVNDLLFAGKFTNGGVLPPRLFDQMAAFGYSAELGAYRWLIDTTGDGVITIGSTDLLVTLPGGTSPVVLGVNVAGAIPIAGNFDNNAANGDEIGLYISGRWLLDTDHSFGLDTVLTGTNMLGAPVVGDFDGDGDDDLAVFNNNVFFFDTTRTGTWNRQLGAPWGFPGTLDKPIAADMDQDGIDDIGLWAPRDSASVPREVSEWYFLVSGSPTAAVTAFSALPAGTSFTITAPGLADDIDAGEIAVGQIVRIVGGVNAGRAIGAVASVAAGGVIVVNPNGLNPGGITPAVGDILAVGGVQNTIVTLDHAFNTSPFGNDIAAEFGDERALPIVGNFDPPVSSTYIAPSSANIDGDFNGDSRVDGADFLSWQRNVANQTPSQSDDDLANWENNFGAAAAAATAGAMAASETVVFAEPAMVEPTLAAAAEPATIVDTTQVAALDSAAPDLAPARVADANLDFVMLVGRSQVRSAHKSDAPARDSGSFHSRDAVLSNWSRRALDRYESVSDSYFDDDWKIAVRGGKADAKRATPEELEDLVFAEF